MATHDELVLAVGERSLEGASAARSRGQCERGVGMERLRTVLRWTPSTAPTSCASR